MLFTSEGGSVHIDYHADHPEDERISLSPLTHTNERLVLWRFIIIISGVVTPAWNPEYKVKLFFGVGGIRKGFRSSSVLTFRRRSQAGDVSRANEK